ncbi:MAG: hypothetical protein IT355_20595 [Gemmatimonadaceae bacterium]|nr:hypothetical protein [Gemmatimonadaceae bacterium]
MCLSSPSPADESQLAKLGFTAQLFAYTGVAMLEGAAAAHPLGVRSEAGSRKYFAGMTALAVHLAPKGWTAEGALEALTNPARTISVAVVQGDSGVGVPSKAMGARRPRGAATISWVTRNGSQLSMTSIAPPPKEKRSPLLYMLVHYAALGVMRMELALPAAIGPDGQVTRWASRIQLGSFGFGQDDTTTRFDFPDDTPNGGGLRPITLVPR